MSRIGRLPIELATGAKVALEGSTVAVAGPKGRLSHALPEGITADLGEKQLVLKRADDSQTQRALHGLMRSLLANAVRGVTTGFTRQLEIHGVGYGAELKGKSLLFKLGFSHPVDFPIPEGIDVKVERNVLTVGGCDRQQVGQVAANIRALRPPDVYKQKGIRYAGEVLRKKAGKAAGAK